VFELNSPERSQNYPLENNQYKTRKRGAKKGERREKREEKRREERRGGEKKKKNPFQGFGQSEIQ